MGNSLLVLLGSLDYQILYNVNEYLSFQDNYHSPVYDIWLTESRGKIQGTFIVF